MDILNIDESTGEVTWEFTEEERIFFEKEAAEKGLSVNDLIMKIFQEAMLKDSSK
jgi:hypothetical protein